jgi:CRP-like cAMP-binding protein
MFVASEATPDIVLAQIHFRFSRSPLMGYANRTKHAYVTACSRRKDQDLPTLDASLLAQVPPFASLVPAQIREILNLAQARRFDLGAHVFDEGEVADRFFLLLDGHIRVVRLTPEGEQVIALHIPSGQLFGIAPALGHSHYPATAVAAADCVVLCWPAGLWHEFVHKYEGFGPGSAKMIGHRVAEMNARIVEMATQAVEQRVANAVLRLIHQNGRKTAEGIEIAFPITRQDLSEMTGTTLHTVSRMLSGWERDGVVKSERRHILVTDPHRLVVISTSSVSDG